MRLSLLEMHGNTDGRGPAGRRGPQRNRRRGLARGLVVAAAVVGGLFVGVAPSGAAAPAPAASTAGPNAQFQFSVQPYASVATQQRSQFAYQLQPGHQILDQVIVRNESQTDETFLVYPEDATNVPRTGGYAYEQRSLMHNTVVGLWVTLGNTTLTVPAGKQVVDTFQLSIPANAPPGDHVGAVVVEQVKGPAQQTSRQGVKEILRVAVPMYVRVVGKSYPGLTIENLTVFHQSPAFPYLSGARVAVRFDIVNTGNDILNPTSVTTSVTGLLSGTIHKYTTHQTGAAQSRANPLPLQMLPGARLTLTEEWSGIPPFDPLTGAVNANAVDASTTQHLSTAASTNFWYFPWIVFLIVLALVAGVIALIVRRRRKARADGAPPSPDEEAGRKGPPPPSSMSDSGTLEGAGI